VSKNRRWSQELPFLLKDLNSTPAGLSMDEAQRRLLIYGPNKLNISRKNTLFEFLSRFSNPLVLVLLSASALSAFLGEPLNFLIIFALVLMSVCLDFFQSFKAESAAETLKKSVELNAQAFRSGKALQIPFSEIVPGDVVQLSAGDIVPADCRILQSKDLFVNQSLFTGESMPVEKRYSNGTQNPQNLEDAESVLFMGTSILSGSATSIVSNTGSETTMADFSREITLKAPATSFDEGIKSFGNLILKLTVFMVLFVLLVNILQHKPIMDSFLFAIALAVGLTPELLPMIITITLSRGALEMAKHQVIVKRLSSINNLGSLNVFCTDKTGTLTEGSIQLEKHINGYGENDDNVLILAYLNSFFETGLQSPLDTAILKHKEVSTEGWSKVDEIPFDFERRRISVLLQNKMEKYLIVKGAAEEILGLSQFVAKKRASNVQSDNFEFKIEDLSEGKRILFESELHKLESNGYRVLGVGFHKTPMDQTQAHLSDESGLIFAGFAAFLDPPKMSAKSTLNEFIAKGIEIKVITGDSSLITRFLFKHLEIEISGELMGHEMENLDEGALLQKVQTCNVFCRVNPSQKNRIILALKKAGKTVGYLGDGVNDAGALHSADVGISVHNATPVARESADIILLKNDLNVLIEGISEGRKTFGNILKYIQMGTSSNFGNMISMAISSLFLPFLPMLPSQILLNNLLYDLSEIPIPFDTVDNYFLERPRSWDMKFIQKFMLIIGSISSIFDLSLFYLLLRYLNAPEFEFRSAWFLESIATQTLVIFLIRTRFHPWKSRPQKLLALTAISIVIFSALLPFTEFGKIWFHLIPLPPSYYLIISGMTLFYLIIVEFIKTRFFRFQQN